MLQDGARTARLRWNPLNLVPVLSSIPRVIDSATSRRNYVIRIAWIDVNGKDIRIIDDAVLNNPPGPASVRGLVRKPPCTGIDHVRVARIDRQRFHVNQVRSVLGGQRRPRFT